jgi:hypothetical protein
MITPLPSGNELTKDKIAQSLINGLTKSYQWFNPEWFCTN